MNFYENNIYLGDLQVALESIIRFEKLNNKSIMITGATGLIGSFIIDVLLYANKKNNSNIEIYAIGRNIERLKRRFEKANSNKLNYIEHDVNDKITFDLKIDYIIHAASNAYPAAFKNDPVGTMISNIVGTKRLLDYARNHDTKRVMFISSGEVYGNDDIGIESFKENYSGYIDPIQVRSCYPISKRAAETLCISYSKQFGLDTIIARPCHCYGANTTAIDNRANVQFINNALQDEDILLRSDGSQVRSYCYIADAVSAILTVLINGESCQAYNISNSEVYASIFEFAETIAKLTGRKVKFEKTNSLCKDEETPIKRQVLNSHKLELLGWSGKYSLKRGIENTLKILKS